MAARPPLAKLTRPKLYGVLARPRLFAMLDEAAKRPIVWVCGAPGSGKTTLVASYIEARARRHLWYQYDAGDADSATFLHYLRMAAQPLAGKAAASLPQFTSEPQQDLGRFVRSFFRELFCALPLPCAVVFDNVHEADAAPALRAALARALEEVPEGITIIAISRADPPAELARLVAAGRIARIDEAELRCTEDEAHAMLGSEPVDPQLLTRIQRESDGWVAALVLLREHWRRRGATLDESLGNGKDAIFQYFAGEIFNGARPENQRVLMLSAIPPSITGAEAVELSGHEDAPRLLEYLYRHHLFTDRRHGGQVTYHYHALFREFLLQELATRITAQERRTVTARAGHLLSARGLQSDALALFRAAGEWDAMRTLVHAHALEWARQGRAQTLSDWIEALPAAMRDADPWLAYWFGRAWIFIEPRKGRPAIERSYGAFRATGDVRGQALALSAIVNSYYYEWATFKPLDRWLPELERLLSQDAPKLDAASELRARAALLVTLLFRKPDDAAAAPCAQRLDELLDVEADLTVRVMAASILLNYINWTTEGESAAALVARIEPIVRKPEVTPLMQVWWASHFSHWHFINGRYAEANDVMTEARAIAERFGLEEHLFDVDHQDAAALINKGDHAAAKARLDIMERRLSPTHRMLWPYYLHLRSILEQRLGHRQAAADIAERALTMVRELDVPSLQMPHFFARLAWARAALGDRDGASRALDEAIARAAPVDRKMFEERRVLLQVEADLNAGETRRAADGLATVLAERRARDDLVFLPSRPDLAARLANLALARDIEPAYVCKLIARHGLVAPDDACTQWPFRLRVRVLGAFELVRDGEPVRFTGKSQARPLELLKFVVAAGSTGVDADHLTSALWPDADGAAAKSSFDSALFRLRKLLDVDDAIELASGQLTLGRSIVWTDVLALEAALEHASAPDARPALAARRLLDAYAGPLLGTDEAAWIAKPRDVLRSRFVRKLMELGAALEGAGDWIAAADVYRRGLEADNLVEPFYRGLMRALVATGSPSEALAAFRRCRELLSIVLGLEPSPETQRLYRDIVRDARS